MQKRKVTLCPLGFFFVSVKVSVYGKMRLTVGTCVFASLFHIHRRESNRKHFFPSTPFPEVCWPFPALRSLVLIGPLRPIILPRTRRAPILLVRCSTRPLPPSLRPSASKELRRQQRNDQLARENKAGKAPSRSPTHPYPHHLCIAQADLETKELRDAARLEASRRAKQEAEAKIREQKAKRQAEVERRREQERADKEARDAKERQEREARRMAAVAEAAKAKAAQEVRRLRRWFCVCWCWCWW